MVEATDPTRELGHPWFDRHAAYKSREIWVCRGLVRGCDWGTRENLRGYYAANQYPDCEQVMDWQSPGYDTTIYFDTWEEAEAWLRGRADGD